MFRKSERYVEIVNLLLKQNKPINGNTISKILNISTRTLRNEIRWSKKDLEKMGIEIQGVTNLGYTLNIVNQVLFDNSTFGHELKTLEDNSLIPTKPEDRIQYLLQTFLTATDYIKISELEEKLFVSRATITVDLRTVRDCLSEFNIILESKPGFGMKIKSDEFYKRACIAKYCVIDYENNAGKIFVDVRGKVEAIVNECMNEKDFKLTDIGYKNLIVHLLLAIIRIKEGNNDMQNFGFDLVTDEKLVNEIAESITKKLEQTFGINFPEIEKNYIIIHLLGKRLIKSSGSENPISQATQNLLNEILIIIKENFDLDFTGDIELFVSLAAHMQPMLNRAKYGLKLDNPLLNQIKKEYFYAYEIALLSVGIIQNKINVEIDSNETGYLALHFALAIERSKMGKRQKGIIIVCASGIGSSQILKHKIRKRFVNDIKEILVVELYELEKVPQQKYDCIITTVPIGIDTIIPVLYVSDFLDDDDIDLISQVLEETINDFSFLDRYFKDKYFFDSIIGESYFNVIRVMCDAIENLPEDFESLVLQREEIAPTEFGNLIAMPHPLKHMGEDFVAFAVLKDPIIWKKELVKYVFLVNVGKSENDDFALLNKVLTSLVFNKEAMKALANEPNIENLKSILRIVGENEKNQEFFR